VLAQRNLGHGGELAAVAVGGSIWILQRSTGSARLIGMAPETLAIRHDRAFAAAAEGLAATGGHVWIGVGTSLAAIDPTSGSTTARIPLPDTIDRVAGDPDSGLLYVTLEGPVRKDRAPLLELDGSSGGLIAYTRAGYADLGGVSHLMPAPGGVWVGEPTGMMGTLGFYPSDRFGPPQGVVGGTDGHGVIHGANSITGAYTAGHLWVASGASTVTCNDARTGRRLGTLTDDGGSADVVTVGDRPMTIVGSTLYSIDEEIACS
jgi:hypothetical protein